MATTKEARRQTRAGRFYEVEGLGSLPSVTTILQVIAKPALLNWMAKVEREMVLEVSADLYEAIHGTPKMSRTAWVSTMNMRLGKTKAGARELAKAGEIGTHAHAMIEWDLRARLGQQPGPKPVILDKALWSFMAFEDWAKAVNLKPLLIEEVVYSEKYGFAGTMDLYAELDHDGRRQRALVDFKTGKAVYAEAYLQNSAYIEALREMGHGDPELGLIVRLPKVDTDPEFEVKVCPPEKQSLPVFLHFLAGWKWSQEMDAQYEADKLKSKNPPAQTQTPPHAPQPAEATASPTKNGDNAPVNTVAPEVQAQEFGPTGVPRAIIPAPPFCGSGKVLSVEFSAAKGKAYAIVMQGEYMLYVTDNVELPIGEGKKVRVFDMLKCAKHSECRFSVIKKKTKKGMSYKVVGVSQIGPYRWDENGEPCYKATDEDVPNQMR